MTIGVPIYRQDAIRIARTTNHGLPEFLLRYCRLVLHDIHDEGERVTIPVVHLKTTRGNCIFLDGATCLVHAAKPYLCKSAPAISLLFNDKKTFEYFREHCPGFGKGRYYGQDKIKKTLKREIALEERERKLFANGVYAGLLNAQD